jgi:hypothetical protein
MAETASDDEAGHAGAFENQRGDEDHIQAMTGHFKCTHRPELVR